MASTSIISSLLKLLPNSGTGMALAQRTWPVLGQWKQFLFTTDNDEIENEGNVPDNVEGENDSNVIESEDCLYPTANNFGPISSLAAIEGRTQFVHEHFQNLKRRRSSDSVTRQGSRFSDVNSSSTVQDLRINLVAELPYISESEIQRTLNPNLTIPTNNGSYVSLAQ
mmetsp:Transcript_25073/g.28896  ORF Transcript_25073/g.28896 Transcript_25073/m.28896 type:complete len:168 (+) Transcript_25073:109-612(+)